MLWNFFGKVQLKERRQSFHGRLGILCKDNKRCWMTHKWFRELSVLFQLFRSETAASLSGWKEKSIGLLIFEYLSPIENTSPIRFIEPFHFVSAGSLLTNATGGSCQHLWRLQVHRTGVFRLSNILSAAHTKYSYFEPYSFTSIVGFHLSLEDDKLYCKCHPWKNPRENFRPLLVVHYCFSSFLYRLHRVEMECSSRLSWKWVHMCLCHLSLLFIFFTFIR